MSVSLALQTSIYLQYHNKHLKHNAHIKSHNLNLHSHTYTINTERFVYDI